MALPASLFRQVLPLRPPIPSRSTPYLSFYPRTMTSAAASSTSVTKKQPDYAKYISKRSAARKPSAIRALNQFLSLPGMISLGGGLPNPSTFPFTNVSVTLQSGETLTLGEARTQKALQYSNTNGIPELVNWLETLMMDVHSPPMDKSNFQICIGNGSQDVLTKAFEMLIDEGDNMLIESPAYVGSLAFLKPLNPKFVEVDTDGDGLNPEALANILDNWPVDQKKPKVLYTVPIAGNPTGTSTTLERKQKIYDIARKHDLIILEDDPYYFLQFGEPVPSYFSMDVDGRVLRFDSLSKIISSGVRIGWVTGPKPLVEKIVLHGQASNLHPSGISQMLVLALLEHYGSTANFVSHCKSVAKVYEQKRDAFLGFVQKHLTGLVEYSIPTAGMFFWMKMLGVNDSAEIIKSKAMEKKVLLVPGFEFFPNPRVTPYVRAAFSTATIEEMDLALQRLAELIREAQVEENAKKV